MRIDPRISNSISAGIQSTEQALQTAVQQLSSGKRVFLPSDDAAAFSANLRSLASSANVDQYTKNADSILTQANAADSALSTVVTSLTQAVSLATQGATGTTNSDVRANLATQVSSILSTIVTQANLQVGGVSVFGGTSGAQTTFTPDASSPNGYAYQGNSGTNQTAVGDGLNVAVNVPGDQVFTNSAGNVLGSLTQLVSALQSNDTTAIGAATTAIDAAISHVSQIRVTYGDTVNQLNSQESYLSQETISLTSQQNSLTNVDLATAATNLAQAQTANTAVLAAAAKVLPVSLLDYLK